MKRSLITAVVLLTIMLKGAEFFVSTSGADTANGKSEKLAFRTIQKGVNALKAGDTLTILPGAYHEAVKRIFDGDAKKKTVIRAKFPGTVLLHGDLPLVNFQLFDAERGLYVTDCPALPEAVVEYDTLSLYEKARPDFLTAPVPNSASWFYDELMGKLYVRTSDGKAPSTHRLGYAVLGADGFLLVPGRSKHVTNVEIDGLITRGFLKQNLGAYSSIWGISIQKPVNCTIRRCTVSLNCGGINLADAEKSRIEECTALGNGTSKMVSGGNIIVTSGSNSIIDRCFSYASRMYGIRFYGKNINDTISRSISIEERRGSVWIKGCDAKSRLCEVFTPGYVACIHAEHSVFRGNEYDAKGTNSKTSLYLNKNLIHAYPDDFADAGVFDLRLTKNSRFKQGFCGKNFVYLAPDGSDQNDGLSRKTPKKSLHGIADGTTVYLLPGKYTAPLQIKQNHITLAGYGQSAPAVITNQLIITGNEVKLKNLGFVSSGVSILNNGNALSVENCGFAGQNTAVTSGKPVTFRHCAFDGTLQKISDHPGSVIAMSIVNHVPRSAILFNNAYAGKVPDQDKCGIRRTAVFSAPAKGDFTLKNESLFFGTAADGTLIGPSFYLYEPEKCAYCNIKVLAAGTQTASLRYEKNAEVRSAGVMLREENGPWKFITDHTVSTPLSYVALTGLKPGTRYQCYALSARAFRYMPGNHYLPAEMNYKKAGQNKSEILSFTTPSADRAPKTWHVSIKGNDRNPGTKKQPLRTITKASLLTAPGDTVMVHQGTYKESILVPFSGTAIQPVTYCAAPGETVWLDGNKQQFCRTFAAFGKQYLHFDGFRVKSFGTALSGSSGVYLLFGCDHIRMTRTLLDGRGGGYTPAILHSRNSHDLEMKNCVSISSMGGLCVINSNRITIQNNVLKMSLIWPLQVFCNKPGVVHFAYNIVTDNIRGKTGQPLLSLDRADAVVEHDNVYFTRLPQNLRPVFGFGGKQKTIDEYYKLTGKNGRSYCADPHFPAMPKQLSWKSWDERKADLKRGIDFQREVNNYENARDPKTYSRFRIWDFRDFFANPVLKAPDGRIIGLEPEAFKDFSYAAAGGNGWTNF